MADISQAKSPETEVIEPQDIELGKILSDEKKPQVIEDLREYPCLWETSSHAYKNRQKKAKAMEELSAKYNIGSLTLKKAIHGFRTAFTREVKREMEDKDFKSKWKYYGQLVYMKEDIIRALKEKELKEWTPEEVEKLLNFYRENEQLWNHNLQCYRDRSLREINMQSLCELFPGRSAEDIKKEWQNLKTIYSREVKREEGSKTSGSGTDTVYTSSWRYFSSMAFIKGNDDIDPPASTMCDVENERPPKKARSTSNKAKVAREMEEVKLDLYKEAIKCLQSPLPSLNPTPSQAASLDSNDDITLFVKSIESTLRKFSGSDLTMAKKAINDAMFVLEMDILHGQSGTVSSPTRHGMQMPLSNITNVNWPYGPNVPNNHGGSINNSYPL